MLPGLFDHYLNKQDDLGSAVDTNAAIQYRAATAITGQPRVRSCRLLLTVTTVYLVFYKISD